MKRRLVIKAYDQDHKLTEQIICGHLDASNKLTTLFESFVINKTYSEGYKGDTIRIAELIDHWNIIDGCITIYYKNGCELEIIRVINND